MSNNHIRFSPPVASLTVAGGKAPERAAGKSVLTVARDQTLSEGIAANSNTGYYFQQLISGSSCHGTPYYASGWLTNTCILTEGGAFYYTCDAGSVTEISYNTTSCSSNAFLKSVSTYPLGCIKSTSGNGIQVSSAGCTTSPNVLPLTSYYYGVEGYYENSQCQGNPVTFSAYVNDECYQMDGTSYLFSFPYRTTYPGSETCSSETSNTDLYFYSYCNKSESSPTYVFSKLVNGMNPTPRPTTNYVAATAITDDGSDDGIHLGLGGIAAIALVISGFIGVVFFLGFFFAVRSKQRSNSSDGNEMAPQGNPSFNRQFT